MDFLQRIPLLLITAGLLIGGVVENDVGSGNQALLAVGFVSFGAWLAIEVQSWYQKLQKAWDAIPETPPLPDEGP
jgi:disulfide bond formation protein DsbB